MENQHSNSRGTPSQNATPCSRCNRTKGTAGVSRAAGMAEAHQRAIGRASRCSSPLVHAQYRSPVRRRRREALQRQFRRVCASSAQSLAYECEQLPCVFTLAAADPHQRGRHLPTSAATPSVLILTWARGRGKGGVGAKTATFCIFTASSCSTAVMFSACFVALIVLIHSPAL